MGEEQDPSLLEKLLAPAFLRPRSQSGFNAWRTLASSGLRYCTVSGEVHKYFYFIGRALEAPRCHWPLRWSRTLPLAKESTFWNIIAAAKNLKFT